MSNPNKKALQKLAAQLKPNAQILQALDKKTTKGMKVRLNLGDGKPLVIVTAGGRKRVMLEKEYDSAGWGEVGYILVNGRIKFNCGITAYAMLEIGEPDGGELGGAYLFVKGKGLVHLGEEFDKLPGLEKKDVWPFKYKIDGEIHCHDHHTDEETGWSF